MNIKSMMGKYDYVSGINFPYDIGTNLHSNAILDTSANSRYVNNRRSLNEITEPSSPTVQVTDGSFLPILASGT